MKGSSKRSQFLPGLIDALEAGVVIVDSRGRPTRLNAAAQRLLGCDPDGSALPRPALRLAGEVQRLGEARSAELSIGGRIVRIRAVPFDGGAMLEVHDLSVLRLLQQAHRLLVAEISDTLRSHVEATTLAVEALAVTDDPFRAGELLADLRCEADSLASLLGRSQQQANQPMPLQTTTSVGIERDDPAAGSTPGEGRPPRGRPTVLLVEPQDRLVGALRIGLEQAGFAVVVTASVHAALNLLEAVEPDCIVLDSLDAGDTEEVHGRVRAASPAPMVLLLGATGSADWFDHPRRLTVGLKRPLHLRDLVTGIHQALLLPDSAPPSSAGEVLAVGRVALDSRAHVVRVDGQVVSVTLKEFELLRILLVHAGQALHRDRLLELLWGDDLQHHDERSLVTLIKRLRGKIEPNPSRPVYIVTVRGLGYRFEA